MSEVAQFALHLMKPAPRCPCCNAPMTDRADPYRLVEHLPISGHALLMARVLAASFGRDVDVRLLMNVLWSGPNGGPLSARKILKQLAHELRVHLVPYGMTVAGKAGRYFGSYRMTWLSEAEISA